MSIVFHYKGVKLYTLTGKIRVAIYISKSIDFIEIKSMSSITDNIMECVAVELK